MSTPNQSGVIMHSIYSYKVLITKKCNFSQHKLGQCSVAISGITLLFFSGVMTDNKIGFSLPVLECQRCF